MVGQSLSIEFLTPQICCGLTCDRRETRAVLVSSGVLYLIINNIKAKEAKKKKKNSIFPELIMTSFATNF